ncbi:MAG TPA: serine/threonine-protein kinase [Myxococcaceae bacterium]|nr:serine/threonine-protein kinase [Myxococcaceae bacterium]
MLCRLSSGGMSEIFLAFQRGLAGFHKVVVLKQILPDIQGEEEIVRMFLDEAKITAAFNHPHIAQVFDLDVQDDELFLAMEFVPGATLIEVARACRLADEPIPLGFSLTTLRDTALALHYAHTFKDPLGRSRQVIHRDVAEKNIMVTYDGVTKLLDFGIAKAQGRESRTAAGKVKGTSGYMSPEQIMGEMLDPRSDVFSLGVVLHECFTGMRLFYGKDAEEGMKAALENKPPPPSRLNPEVGPELDAVVMRALARDRKDRFSSALELARALERAGQGRMWLPEQCGELMLRHFSDRRDQTRKLLEDSTLADNSGEILLPRRRGDGEPSISGISGARDKDKDRDRVVRVDPLSPMPGPRRGGPSSLPPGVLPPPPMVMSSGSTDDSTANQRPQRNEVTVIGPPPQGRQGKPVDPDEEQTHAGPAPVGRRLEDAPEVTDPLAPQVAPPPEPVTALEPEPFVTDPEGVSPASAQRRRQMAVVLGLLGGLGLGFFALLRLLEKF